MSELSNGDLIARLRQVRDLVIPSSEAEYGVFRFAEDCEPILIRAVGKIAGIVMATLELSAAARDRVVLSSSPPAPLEESSPPTPNSSGNRSASVSVTPSVTKGIASFGGDRPFGWRVG